MAASVVFTDQRLSPSHPVSVVPSKILVNPRGIGKTPAAGLAGPPPLVAASSLPASGAPVAPPGLEPPAPEPPLAPLPPTPPGEASESRPLEPPSAGLEPEPPDDVEPPPAASPGSK